MSGDGSSVFYSTYGKREAYLVASAEGEPTKICEDCGTWNVSHDATHLLYGYSTAKSVVSVGVLHLPTGKKVELIRHPTHSLYRPRFSPDDRYIAFLAQTGQGRSRIYPVPFEGMERLDRTQWIPITRGEVSDDRPRWSPDSNDGFMCIWAQRLQPDTKQPVGEPFSVHNFDTSRRSLASVGLGRSKPP
jgi:eukaryotic-like serine/threonine-protein kinase